MIRDHLLPALASRFPDRFFVIGTFPDADVTLPFPYEKIGPLEISDDGDEVTVFIGEVTHGHFGCYEESYSEEEMHRQIVENVMDFLDDLFADRVVLFRALGGRTGGWRTLASDQQPKRFWFGEQFLWSRPL